MSTAPSVASKIPTKRCKFFMEGKCTKGDSCTFLHDSRFAPTSQVNISQSAPHKVVYRSTILCKYGDKCKRDSCLYKHAECSQSKPEQLDSVKPEISQGKSCRYGDKCNLTICTYLHPKCPPARIPAPQPKLQVEVPAEVSRPVSQRKVAIDKSTILCNFGEKCNKKESGCPYLHVPENLMEDYIIREQWARFKAIPICVKGTACERFKDETCTYRHEGCTPMYRPMCRFKNCFNRCCPCRHLEENRKPAELTDSAQH